MGGSPQFLRLGMLLGLSYYFIAWAFPCDAVGEKTMQPVVRGSHPLVWRDTSRKLPLLPEKAVPDPHMRELTIGSTKHHYRPSADCVYLHRASTITSTLCTEVQKAFWHQSSTYPALKIPYLPHLSGFIVFKHLLQYLVRMNVCLSLESAVGQGHCEIAFK